jgi:hypothetical protein
MPLNMDLEKGEYNPTLESKCKLILWEKLFLNGRKCPVLYILISFYNGTGFPKMILTAY